MNEIGALGNRVHAGAITSVAAIGVPRGAEAIALESAVRRAALAVTDFSWLSRGDSVLIKPVCNSGRSYPATTDPVALRAMIGLLRERGAGRVIVADMSGVQFIRFDRDRLRGSTRALMGRNGLAATVEAAGGEVHAFEESGWDGFHEEVPRGGERWSAPVMMPNVLEESDHVVLMPRCGRHLLAGSTLGLKAAVGWWRHDSRLLFHREGKILPEKTAEANTVPSLLDKQRLVLTSATRVMTTFGPDDGWISEPETGLVIASESVVAHDMVSLAWLIENRRVTPARVRDAIARDPHRSGAVRNLTNRVVSHWLGSPADALETTTPPFARLDSIWDDRVLTGAFEAFGGVPEVEFVDPERTLPAALLSSLQTAVAR